MNKSTVSENFLRQCEKDILQEGQKWMQEEFRERIQERIDAIDLKCPVSGQRLSSVRMVKLQLDCLYGTLTLLTPCGYSEQQKEWINLARDVLGLEPYQRLTPLLEERLTYTTTKLGSYEAAAQMSSTWGCPVTDTRLHRLVQRKGQQALELILPKTPEPTERKQPDFNLVIMMDGWMVPERGPDWGVSREQTQADRVVWREIKNAVIYRLEQSAKSAGGRGLLIEKYVVATPPETSPVDFGAAVQQEAYRRGMAQAKTVYLVMDGAVWLWDLAEDRFSHATKTLDFHHARDHLWALAHALHPDNEQAAKDWVEPLLKSLRNGQENKVLKGLTSLLAEKTDASDPNLQAIEVEVNYFVKHKDHVHYKAMKKAGAPQGSGAVESLGKQFQQRLRGCGQKWCRLGLTNLLLLCVLVKNGDLSRIWD